MLTSFHHDFAKLTMFWLRLVFLKDKWTSLLFIFKGWHKKNYKDKLKNNLNNSWQLKVIDLREKYVVKVIFHKKRSSKGDVDFLLDITNPLLKSLKSILIFRILSAIYLLSDDFISQIYSI